MILFFVLSLFLAALLLDFLLDLDLDPVGSHLLLHLDLWLFRFDLLELVVVLLLLGPSVSVIPLKVLNWDWAVLSLPGHVVLPTPDGHLCGDEPEPALVVWREALLEGPPLLVQIFRQSQL